MSVVLFVSFVFVSRHIICHAIYISETKAFFTMQTIDRLMWIHLHYQDIKSE